GIAAALARDLGVDTPYLKKTLELWRAAERSLRPNADHTEIYRYLERRTPPSRGARARRSSPRRKPRRSSAAAARPQPRAKASSRARGRAAGNPARQRPPRA